MTKHRLPWILRPLVVFWLVAALGACNTHSDPRTKVTVERRNARTVTVPVAFASSRPVVELAFVRSDGSERRALAWVNMGAPAPILSKSLYRELGIDRGLDLAVRLGGIAVTVAADAVVDGPGELDGRDLFSLLFAPRAVEAILPASVLSQFQMVLDPTARTLTLAAPGTLKLIGVPVPIRVNSATGVATVDAQAAGSSVSLVLDAGAPYTWLRGSTVASWLEVHPDWYRANGAMGRANLAMADLGLERLGIVIRLPELRLGRLIVRDVGALGTGPLLGRAGDALLGEVFWDTWQKGAGEPVAGWLGGNVIGDYKLAVDYAAGMTYWQRQRRHNPRDLDGVALTLARDGAGYAVTAVADRYGERLVKGIESGDRLLAVDDIPLWGEPPDHALAKLGGKPGDRRRLELLHAGERKSVDAIVSGF